MKERYMVVDLSLCHDCNNCFVACKDEHCANSWLPYTDEQPWHGHRWMNIERRERGAYPRIDVCYLPKPCQHCDDAPCVKKHPDCVTRREDGIILIDPEKAKGRRELVDSCPCGAIYWNEEKNVPQKCTMCAHLLDGEDDLKVPRCVHACPTGAMEFYTMEPAQFKKIIDSERLERCVDKKAGGHVYYKNLHRFEKNFVSGGLLREGECAEGVTVTLKGDGVSDSQVTDYFGDFKFDALVPGEYSILVDGRELKKVRVDTSVNVGSLVI